MIVVGALVGVVLAVFYFKKVNDSFLKNGIILGLIWLVVNWTFDLIMVGAGFFPLSISQYFTEIGLRYLSMPIYTVGMGKVLASKM